MSTATNREELIEVVSRLKQVSHTCRELRKKTRTCVDNKNADSQLREARDERAELLSRRRGLTLKLHAAGVSCGDIGNFTGEPASSVYSWTHAKRTAATVLNRNSHGTSTLYVGSLGRAARVATMMQKVLDDISDVSDEVAVLRRDVAIRVKNRKAMTDRDMRRKELSDTNAIRSRIDECVSQVSALRDRRNILAMRLSSLGVGCSRQSALFGTYDSQVAEWIARGKRAAVDGNPKKC